MASSSSSSSCLSLSFPSSCLSGNWDYDVFPSFHGKDVRTNFLSHVLKEFSRKGINLFIDNEIKKGEFIGPELKRAIRGSKIAVVLLSKNYGSSSWCLDELVEIMKRKESGQIVIPIFYNVDPTDVRMQTGYFGKVFKQTCHGKGKDKKKTETWRKSLEGVANIGGYHSGVRVDDASMIEEISNAISVGLHHLTPSHDFENFVGLEKHMERLKPLLCLDLDERRMIGIWGPSGIGKTTIVRYLLNELSSCFHHSALIEDIKCRYPYPKLCFDEHKAKLQLQNEMLTKMINHGDTTMISHLGVAQQRLKNKKVLLVLDDVDRLGQLDALAGNVEWFGPGSRIIITTENRRLLKAIGINHTYEVVFPSTKEAFEMFCMYAFRKKSPEDGFDELACEITYLVGELPLGLAVMGSHFRGLCKDKEEWLNEISWLKRTNLDGDIERILKFSYDALSDDCKDLFLHIACFFSNVDLDDLEKYLAKRFKDLNHMLNVLRDKSLISFEEYGKDVVVWMHKLLVQLGQEIVLKESVCEPGNRQFLNDYKDVCQILTDSTTITRSVFEGTFRVVYDFGHPIIISWRYCPFTCLDFTNDLEFIVELDLSYSKLEKLWNRTKLLRNLKRLDLSHSDKLKELPNLSMATNLERLNLERCSSLVKLPSFGNATNLQQLILVRCSSLMELHYTIGNATNLPELNLKECSSLVEIPASIGNVTNLRKLNLYGCSSLVELPSSIWNATNLEELEVGDWSCSTLVLPYSIEKATNLQRLYLDRCSNMVELPASIWNAPNLRELNLIRCSGLVELPVSIGNATNLEKLNLQECSSLVELPASIGNATNLRELNLYGCSSLLELPTSIGNAANLEKLNLQGCSSLVELPISIGNATNLEKLDLEECSSLMKLPSSIGEVSNLRDLNLRGCSSLVELPTSIGNAANLEKLNLRGCSSLVELPTSIGNATNLEKLDLEECSSLMKLPSSIGEASNLRDLNLRGCSSLVELPTSIGNAANLEKLNLQGCSSLVELPTSIGNATNLEKLDLEECSSLVKLPSSIGEASNLRDLNLRGCSSLISLPQLPKSIAYLYAKNCKSLEKLDCSFFNRSCRLDFINCFNLNKETRDIIIQTSTHDYIVLPGKEVPECFTYRASGSCVTVKLNEKLLPTSTKFKACILANRNGYTSVSVIITSRHKNGITTHRPNSIYFDVITEHLHVFNLEAEVTSTELDFTFKLESGIEIKECGVLPIIGASC